jgi:tRNA-specific 2-thiouridylase
MRLVARAADERKDQSYMLAAVDPEVLARVRFPLGEQTKEETRAEAAALGLAAAHRAESQEACFLGGDDYRAFLERQGLTPATGPIVDADGTRLGRHDGHWRFTAGQRRGLDLNESRRLYVLDTDAASNTVTVGSREQLAVTAVRARGRLYRPVAECDAKLRYRSDPVRADVVVTDGGFELELDTPAYGVARGQVAVLYEDEAVVGAGMITSVSALPLGSPR